MNIKNIITKRLLSLNLVRSIVAKPAVLAVTDWKKATSNFSKPVIPDSEWLYSPVNKRTVPRTKRNTIINTPSLLVSFHFLRLFPDNILAPTKNPAPPKIIRAAIVNTTTGLL